MNLTCNVTVCADVVPGRIWCEDSLVMAAHGLQQLKGSIILQDQQSVVSLVWLRYTSARTTYQRTEQVSPHNMLPHKQETIVMQHGSIVFGTGKNLDLVEIASKHPFKG